MTHELTPAKNPAALLAELQAKYPSHRFALSDKDECGCTDDADAPQLLITFEHDGMCIVDPLMKGFDYCAPSAGYGVAPADALAIRAHNRVCGA